MRTKEIDQNAILKLTLDFSVTAVAYCEELESQKKYVVGRQLLRSGTSIGANAMEAQHAESNADFTHKMKIAAKEACETQYWLLICERAESYPLPQGLQEKLEVINRILSSIIGTAKRKNPLSYFLTLFM
jgi:four helix bundle protein